MESATHGAMRIGVFCATRSAWTHNARALGSRADFQATDAALIRAALHHSRRQFSANAIGRACLPLALPIGRVRPAEFDRDVATFDEAGFAQTSTEG